MAEENTEKAGGAPTGRDKSRRRELVGVVTSDKMTKTRVVLVERRLSHAEVRQVHDEPEEVQGSRREERIQGG